MFKVGDKVWTFDENRRIYVGSGIYGAKIIYAGHFVHEEIVGETSRSWIVGRRKKKISKKKSEGIIFTDEQKDANIWMHDYRYKIIQMVEQCRNVDTLRKIAEIVGYGDSIK